MSDSLAAIGRGAPSWMETTCSRSTHATPGSARSDAITDAIRVVSVTRNRAARMAGEMSASLTGCPLTIAAMRCRIAACVIRADASDRYAAEPAAATLRTPLRKPTTIRLVPGLGPREAFDEGDQKG